jgi:predicted nucleic acid-binding protein
MGWPMVLVDTSVWIRYFRGAVPYVTGLNGLLGLGQVAGHELVYGELLIGDPGGRRRFLVTYSHLPQAAMVPHAEVVYFANHRRFHGRGLSWIDAHLLASAVAGGFQLWTADERFAAIAQELGIGYQKPPVA